MECNFYKGQECKNQVAIKAEYLEASEAVPENRRVMYLCDVHLFEFCQLFMAQVMISNMKELKADLDLVMAPNKAKA